MLVLVIVALVLGTLLVGTTAFAGHGLLLAAAVGAAAVTVWLAGAAVRLAGVHGTVHDDERWYGDRVALTALLSGATGLFVANGILGPLAIGLGVLAVRRHARLLPTAMLAVGLGVADLVLLVAMVASHGFTWQFAS
jgi:hypothetical protein